MEQHKYGFEGSIVSFGKPLGRFEAQTKATSEKKARSNFEFQAKQKCNLLPNSKIELVGRIFRID